MGYPLFSVKVIAGVLIGILGGLPIFPLLRGVIISLIVGALGIAVAFKKLDNKKDAMFIPIEFVVLGIVAEAIGTYLLQIWF